MPVIGPIISAIPAVLIAATAGIEAVIAALVLYTLVQQVENNFLVPKIQGDATDLHPAAVIFAIIIGGALAGLLGAILALPVLAASRDVVRYLFRRLSPEDPRGRPAARSAASTWTRLVAEDFDPYKTLQVDPEADDEVIRAAYRGLARKYHPDVAPGPEAAARMAAINVAWELVGDPDARRRYDRSRTDAACRAATSPPSAGAAEPTDVRPARAPKPPPPEQVSRDWTSGRSSTGGGYDPSMRAPRGPRRRGAATRAAVGQRPQLRPLRGLVARRDRAVGHRVHRVARPGADRAPVPRRDRPAPAQGRPARLRGHGAARPARAVPPPLSATGGQAAAAPRRQAPRGDRATSGPRSCPGPAA